MSPPGKKKHVTIPNRKENTRRSYDIEDTGIRGVGSNWVKVSDPHFTDQNVSKGSSGRHSGDKSQSKDMYGD